MGCDIHLELERREGDAWRRVPHPELPCDGYYCEGGVYSDETPNPDVRGTPCYSCKGKGSYVRPFYRHRNYDTFAILANVRNGTAFAGTDTGDGFIPVADPRGLPHDLSAEIAGALALDGYTVTATGELDYRPSPFGDEDSEEYRQKIEALLGPGWTSHRYGKEDEHVSWEHPQTFWLGDHSWSHVSVAELLVYDWDRETKHRGWVGPWNFELWRREGKPRSYCGGVSGASIEHISNQQMARMIDEGEIIFEEEGPEDTDGERPYTTGLMRAMSGWDLPKGSVGAAIAQPGVSHYTNVEWPVLYKEAASDFLEVLHRDIVPLGEPGNVRLVFGFDS